MSDNNNHAEIIELVREAAQAGDAYHLARKRLAEALGLDPKGNVGDPLRLFQIIELTNPVHPEDVEESARVLLHEKANGDLFEEL